ncbi:hypothetical protein GAMM_120036 [Gammaproteobacteria bacterium]
MFYNIYLNFANLYKKHTTVTIIAQAKKFKPTEDNLTV